MCNKTVFELMIDEFLLKRMKLGDIIMIGTEGNLLSNMIKRFTGSIWSHVGIYTGNGSYVQATFPKIKISSIYELVRQNSYRKFTVFRVPDLIEFDRNHLASEAFRHLDKRYDALGLLGQMLGIIFGKKIFLQRLQHTDKYFCSELIGKCYKKIGVKFSEADSLHITPEDIVTSGKVEKIVEFK